MLRKVLVTLLLFLPAPALAQSQGQEQVIQLILNITQGSPSTPGQVGYLVLADRNLQAAIEAADAAARSGPGNLDGLKRNIDAVALSIDPPPDFEGDTYGFVRSVAGIAGNAEFASQMPGASANVKTQSQRIDASVDNVIEWSEAVLKICRYISRETDPDKAANAVSMIQTHLARIRSGHDADKDGTVGWQKGEGGFTQIEQNVRQLAGGEGLTPIPQ